MHHDSINDLPEELKKSLFGEPTKFDGSVLLPKDSRDPYLKIEGLGKTGNFPEGKLTDTDEGEIAFGVAVDFKSKKILVDFGTPVVWFGMDSAQAKQLVDMLNDKIAQLDKLTFQEGMEIIGLENLKKEAQGKF